MKFIIALIFSLLTFPVHAGGSSAERTPHEHTTVIVDDNDHSSRNIFLGAAIVAAGVCIYHRCWKEVPEAEKEPITERLRITPR